MFYNSKEWVEFPLINADDDGFTKGYSVYEVFRTYSGQVFALADYYSRLRRSTAFLGLELPEFEKIVDSSDELELVRTELDALMTELGVEELSQDRLARMFDFYNQNWPEYYGTDKVFEIE